MYQLLHTVSLELYRRNPYEIQVNTKLNSGLTITLVPTSCRNPYEIQVNTKSPRLASNNIT